MKCAAHSSEAIAVCAWCGRAICNICGKPSAAGRMVCSDNCATALTREAKAMDLILQKSLQNALSSAFYFFLCGLLLAAGAVGARFYLPSPFLIWFCAGSAAVFIITGTRYAWIARKTRE